MPSPLTPEQQAALDQFETDAQAAQQSAVLDVVAQADLQTAELNAEHSRQTALDAHIAALASAQAFIDLMVPAIDEAAKSVVVPAGKKA